jgi:hypothetical protein
MHLILVAPGLLAQPQPALAAASSLATLAQLAPAAHVYVNGIAAALLDALDAPAQTPIAPLAALGATSDAAADYVIAADPVLLAADRDDLVLVQRIDDLSVEEAATFVTLLNRHFDADGLEFVAARPDAWFARCARAPAMTTTPFEAARLRGIFPYLPRGEEAGVWQRWQNEIGMLLHEHPVNEAREVAGKTPVTGIWFSGGGRLTDADALPCVIVHAATGRSGDLARGIARRGGGSAHLLAPNDALARVLDAGPPRGVAAKQPHVVIVVAMENDTGPAAFAANWLEPALDRLRRKRVARVTLIADGHGAALRWTAAPPTFWQRICTRVRSKPFAIPVRPAS